MKDDFISKDAFFMLEVLILFREVLLAVQQFRGAGFLDQSHALRHLLLQVAHDPTHGLQLLLQLAVLPFHFRILHHRFRATFSLPPYFSRNIR